ncbi:hypothetical protein FGB62_171g01 [Gracilaria domingensis]|nr:hypothetical protein FGB62_171g01 [Gracilaria domingensis]
MAGAAGALGAISLHAGLNVEAVTFEVDDKPRSSRLMCVVTPAPPEPVYLHPAKNSGDYSGKNSSDTSDVDAKSESDIKLVDEAVRRKKASPWASFGIGAFVELGGEEDPRSGRPMVPVWPIAGTAFACAVLHLDCRAADLLAWRLLCRQE